MLIKRLFAGFLGILLLFSVLACQEQVRQRDTVRYNGLLYKAGEDQPFTGVVTGKGREDYRRVAYEFRKEYKNGLQDGETVFIFPNGKLESKLQYKNGKVNGFAIRYWPNGRPRARIHFVDGMRGGLQGEMFWDKEGRQIKS